jgi:hypothetical protein
MSQDEFADLIKAHLRMEKFETWLTQLPDSWTTSSRSSVTRLSEAVVLPSEQKNRSGSQVV